MIAETWLSSETVRSVVVLARCRWLCVSAWPAIPWTRDVLGISLAPILRSERGLVFADLVEQIADAALADKRPRHVVVDEAVTYTTSSVGGGQALERLGAEGPHWKVGGIFVSQRVSGFLATRYGASVLDSVASTLYLRQKDTEAKRIAQRLELSPVETKFLQQATISDKYREGLLVVGEWRVGLKIEASQPEHHLAATP